VPADLEPPLTTASPTVAPWPTELRLSDGGRLLAVAFDDGTRHELSAEYLRVESPSAEVQGHAPSQRQTQFGKRNVTISQLSGGEKALTAVALVFSIFELNPAPFCLLDEVDAPLDENNVGRFCDIVREMSQRVQFIFITHNKSTMELASQLLGVTMNEPGVSRLVSVDVDEAVRLATLGAETA
jgi:hypothetical protein